SLEQFSTLDGVNALNALAGAKPASSGLGTMHLDTLNQLCAKLSEKLLFKTSKNKDMRLKKCAIKTLAAKSAAGKSKLKKRLLPILKSQVKSTSTELRALAIEGLGDLNEKSTYPLLLKATKDSDASVVAAATLGLRHVPDSEARLLELASHASPLVVAAALDAMGVQELPSAIPLILKNSESSDLHIRLASTRALGRLSAKIAKPKAAFAFYSLRLTDGNADVRRLALIGLSKSEDERSIQAMASLALDLDQTVQITAINLLGASGAQQAIEGASAGLVNSNPTVRRASIVALKKIGGAEANAILKRHMEKESNKELRSLLN
ncbi:MAG: HEAT repeat domain-containing protein, partial [Bradymonadia bacterium]